MELNNDDEFLIDFSILNSNNQTNSDDKKANNIDITHIAIIGGISIFLCSIFTGLIYLCYQNHMLLSPTDSSVETTAKNPLGNSNIDVGIGEYDENRGSDYSDFLGGNPLEFNNI